MSDKMTDKGNGRYIITDRKCVEQAVLIGFNFYYIWNVEIMLFCLWIQSDDFEVLLEGSKIRATWDVRPYFIFNNQILNTK